LTVERCNLQLYGLFLIFIYNLSVSDYYDTLNNIVRLVFCCSYSGDDSGNNSQDIQPAGSES